MNIPLAIRTRHPRQAANKAHTLTFSERYDLAESMGDYAAMELLYNGMLQETMEKIETFLAE